MLDDDLDADDDDKSLLQDVPVSNKATEHEIPFKKKIIRGKAS